MFRIAGVAALIWAAGVKAQDSAGSPTITEADCSSPKLGDNIPASAIGEPVSAASLSAPQWTPGAKGQPGYCNINGAMAPVDRAPNAQPINFQVAMPASWNGRSAQLGGGGMNGFIPPLTAGPGSPFARGFVTYGSDSGHQAGGYDRGSCRCHEPAEIRIYFGQWIRRAHLRRIVVDLDLRPDQGSSDEDRGDRVALAPAPVNS
jgi:Tannase and feruloyl esterase